MDQESSTIQVNIQNNFLKIEFLAATIDTKLYLKEERLYEAFRVFDKDNSGKISSDEIKKVLHSETKEDDDNIEKMMKQIDINGDGEVRNFSNILD